MTVANDLLSRAQYELKQAQDKVDAMIKAEYWAKHFAEKYYPNCPPNCYNILWYSGGAPYVLYYMPWDKTLADNLMLQLINLGWKLDREIDERKGAGEYKFVFFHSDLPNHRIDVEMEAQRKGSRCEMRIVGHETVEKPIYQVICADTESL